MFDNQENLVPSTLTESVQIRVYHAITDTSERSSGGNMARQQQKQRTRFLRIQTEPAAAFFWQGWRTASGHPRRESIFDLSVNGG